MAESLIHSCPAFAFKKLDTPVIVEGFEVTGLIIPAVEEPEWRNVVLAGKHFNELVTVVGITANYLAAKLGEAPLDFGGLEALTKSQTILSKVRYAP